VSLPSVFSSSFATAPAIFLLCPALVFQLRFCCGQGAGNPARFLIPPAKGMSVSAARPLFGAPNRAKVVAFLSFGLHFPSALGVHPAETASA
jgi:hypothetical protein